MLETIASDFERTHSTTEAAEAEAAREYVKFDRETKASISTKETGLKQTVNDLMKTNGDLEAALETLEKLRPACVDTGMSYEERVERREAEIEALKQALCVLDEGDKEISECNHASFLQKRAVH